MPYVFISYTDQDEHQALAVRDALAAAGLDVWVAPKALQGGDRLTSIFSEIERADVVVVLLSQRSVSSKWVQREMSTAVAFSLDRGKPRVIPALLEPISLPAALVDVRAVILHGRNFEQGTRELAAACRGEQAESASLHSRLASYLRSFDVVPEAVASGADETYRIARSEYPRKNEEQRRTWENAREVLRAELARGDCPTGVMARALATFDRGNAPRLMSAPQQQQALSWLRGADELSVLFAAELWRLRTGGRGLSGITLNWVFGFLRGAVPELRGRAYYVDSGQYEWRASELIDKAFALGLLVRSTETPRGHYEKLDARSNPSFNFGPNVFTMGKLVARYLEQHPQRPPAEAAVAGPASDDSDTLFGEDSIW